MRADDLQQNVTVYGSLFPEPVQVIVAIPLGNSRFLRDDGVNECAGHAVVVCVGIGVIDGLWDLRMCARTFDRQYKHGGCREHKNELFHFWISLPAKTTSDSRTSSFAILFSVLPSHADDRLKCLFHQKALAVAFRLCDQRQNDLLVLGEYPVDS
jgi:hypothetical protein